MKTLAYLALAGAATCLLILFSGDLLAESTPQAQAELRATLPPPAPDLQAAPPRPVRVVLPTPFAPAR